VTVRYDGPDELVVQADAGQLRQVVWNLVRNAVQVNGPGAPVTVRVTAPDEAEPARLEVVDEGPGIPPAARDRLFDAFFTTRSSGIGIGLAVVKRIVDDHGWSIDVESETGQGATFRVRLTSPLVRAPSASRTSLLPARAFRSVPPPKPGHPKSVPPRAAPSSETDPPPSVDRMGSKPV
jgi:signal transduction histidine kinase